MDSLKSLISYIIIICIGLRITCEAINPAQDEGLDSSPSPPSFICNSKGKFTNPKNCTKYYKCKKANGGGSNFLQYEFTCPSKMFFSQSKSKCISGANNCAFVGGKVTGKEIGLGSKVNGKSRSSLHLIIDPITGDQWKCPSEGTFPDKGNCHQYHFCRSSGGSIINYKYTCPRGSFFNGSAGIGSCIEGPCNSPVKRRTTTPRPSPPPKPFNYPFNCREVGTFVDPLRCAAYHRCEIDEDGPGGFKKITLNCPQGQKYIPIMKRCFKRQSCGPL